MAKTTWETFTTTGEQLLKKIKELIAEGNVRKIIIKDKHGKEMMTFPLNPNSIMKILVLLNIPTHLSTFLIFQ